VINNLRENGRVKLKKIKDNEAKEAKNKLFTQGKENTPPSGSFMNDDISVSNLSPDKSSMNLQIKKELGAVKNLTKEEYYKLHPEEAEHEFENIKYKNMAEKLQSNSKHKLHQKDTKKMLEELPSSDDI